MSSGQIKYVDLTHIISDNMPVFPGDISVELKPTATFEENGIANHSLYASVHVGTHIDAPGHFTDNNKKITDFSVSQFIGKAVCINAQDKKIIDETSVANNVLQKDDIVLFCTGFDKQFYEKNYFYDYPVISQECAKRLVEIGVKMVGVDFPSVDKAPWLVHKLLLTNDILIIENLTNLELLVGKRFDMIALPLKIDAHGAPARVVAIVQD